MYIQFQEVFSASVVWYSEVCEWQRSYSLYIHVQVSCSWLACMCPRCPAVWLQCMALHVSCSPLPMRM